MIKASCRLGALLALALALAIPASALADRGFTSRFSANDTGDITFVANTLMTCPDTALCTQARNGTATPISNLQNNAYAMTYVDTDSSSSTFNSSTSNLALPAGSTVLFAGLYWGGDRSGSGSNAAPDSSNRDEVVLKAPGDSAYRNVTASTLDAPPAAPAATRASPTSPRSSPRPATGPTPSATSRPARAPTSTRAGRS